MPTNYYVILGISPDANLAQIRRAYNKLVHECHPDHNPAGAQRFILLKAACDTLSNPAQRAQHDRQIHAHASPRLGHVVAESPIDLFHDFEAHTPSAQELLDVFARNFSHRHEPKTRRMRDLHVELPLPPEQALHGGALSLAIPIVEPCRACSGTGRIGAGDCERCEGRGSNPVQARVDVIIPPGVTDGAVIPVPLGHLGIRNLNLQVHLHIPGGWAQ